MWQIMKTARLRLERYGRTGERFHKRIVTLDETWVRSYQPKLKRQSNQWRLIDYPWPKKYRQEQDPLKVVFVVAYDFDGVLVTHSVPPENPVTFWTNCAP